MEGTHTLARCGEVTGRVLRAVFDCLDAQRVLLEGVILKPNMVLPGAGCPAQTDEQEVARATLTCLRRAVPAAVAGVAFLSGGQSPEAASGRLNAMHAAADAPPSPWALTFSFARAIQRPALELWRGQSANVAAAQAALLDRARCNSLARKGLYLAPSEPRRAAS